jgi:glycosyltransferase involved in cell wall biosynthesis
MKIHFFVRTLNEKTGGGSHYNSIAYMRALREVGHTVVAHVMYDVDSNAFPPDIQPIVHQGFGLSFLQERTYIAKLLKEYESEADIFFLYAVEFAWGGGLYRKSGRVPVVVYMDAYLASMRVTHMKSLALKLYQYKRLPWDKLFGLRDAARIDQFLPCSPYIGDAYQKFGFPHERFTVLSNIVPPPEIPTVPPKNQQDIITVVYVGRLIYDKGIDLLIGALTSIKGYTWKLSIVGGGEMERYVQERIQKEHLPITMHGWVSQKEVGRYYAEADFFVHPARWPDPAPRTIVDALYCNLPVVVPDTGGSAWIAGDAGVVFKTGDLTSLTAALNKLVENKDNVRGELAARAKVQAYKFEKATVYPQLESVLKKTIEDAQKLHQI